MRIFISFLLVFICFSIPVFSQDKDDIVMMSVQQHEALRKDITNYGILIKKYELLSESNKKIMRDFEKLEKEFLIYKDQFNNTKVENMFIKNHNLDIKIENLETEIEKLKETILQNEKEKKTILKSLYVYKGKYLKEKTLNRGDRIIQSTIYSIFGACVAWTIYTSIENHYMD